VGEVGRVVISAAPSPLPFYDDPIERGEIVSFAPGDLGFIDFDGVLHLLGREDNVLNVGGTKMLAEDLETAIGRAAGVRDCGIALKPDEFGIDRVVCALVLAAGFDQDKFLAHCEANVLRDFLPTTFTVVPAIPRTGNRKVDRAGLARLF
jgi:acyl-coenzyme A synthetase/AMP-(fatty) acid ligase